MPLNWCNGSDSDDQKTLIKQTCRLQKQAALLFKLSQDQQNQSQDQEDSTDPLGCAGNLSVHALGLVLCQEGKEGL